MVDPIVGASFNDNTMEPAVQYYYVVAAQDTSGNRSAASDPIAVTQPRPLIDKSINFQPDTAPLATGYIKDAGAAYSAARGYGWFRLDSLPTTHIRSTSARTRVTAT